MDFSLTEDQKMLKTMLRDFAVKELEPVAAQIDQTAKYPEEQVKKLVELKRYVEGEKLINLENLSKESDPTLRRQMKQQNYAIDSLLRLLEGVPRMGVLSSDEEAALEALRANQ